jgi:hypothetical protein
MKTSLSPLMIKSEALAALRDKIGISSEEMRSISTQFTQKKKKFSIWNSCCNSKKRVKNEQKITPA